VEGRNIVLASTILSILAGGLLIYSSWVEMNSPNRKEMCIAGMVVGGLAVFLSAIGLIGLCRFSDTDKTVFRMAYWMNLIQLWFLSSYAAFLLYLWDGNWSSGTLPLRSSSASSSTTTTTPATFIELASGESAFAGLVEGTIAPPNAPTSGVGANFFKVLSTQIYFIGLTAVLILLGLLYTYGSLRLKCKKMGKVGTTISAFFLIGLSAAILLLSIWTIVWNNPFQKWPAFMGLVGQMAVSCIVIGTAVYEMWLSSQISKLKLSAQSRFVTLIVLTWISAVLAASAYYTYYQSIHVSPRIDTLSIAATLGFAEQLLLITFGVQLVAWRYALPDEYGAIGDVEKYGQSANEGAEDDPFMPPATQDV